MCDSLRDPTGILPSPGVLAAGILFARCLWYGRHMLSGFFCPRNSAKHVKQRKGDVDIVAYSDPLVGSHVRRIYWKKGEEMSLNRTICLGRDAKQVNFIACMHVYKKKLVSLFSWISLDGERYYRKLRVVINHKVYPTKEAFLYLL